MKNEEDSKLDLGMSRKDLMRSRTPLNNQKSPTSKSGRQDGLIRRNSLSRSMSQSQLKRTGKRFAEELELIERKEKAEQEKAAKYLKGNVGMVFHEGSDDEDLEHTREEGTRDDKGIDDLELSRFMSARNADLAAATSDLKYSPIYLRDPRKFKEEGYDKDIRFTGIKLLTVVTMYNEAPAEMIRTLRGICDNVRSLIEKTGDDLFWQKFAVVIVSDGREKINKDTLQLMCDAELCDDSLLDIPEDPELRAKLGVHQFQTSAIFVEDADRGIDYPPLQTIFCLKEHNGGKLDSHWWYLEAYAAAMQPQYCILNDVGTRPLKKAYFRMYQVFERNPQVAALGGEIRTRDVVANSRIISAQHFEYKVSTLLDKAMESLAGYVSVLPGCFSAYRLEAIEGTPLRKYFIGRENPSDKPMNCFMANIYLVEDRILSMEVFAREDKNQTLHSETGAVAEVDACETLVELMKQRRRWYNGSFCATLYMIYQFPRIYNHPLHTPTRKFATLLSFAYYAYSMIAGFLMPGVCLMSAEIVIEVFAGNKSALQGVYRAIVYISIFAQIYVGITYKPQNCKKFYEITSIIFGFILTFITILVMFYTYSNAGKLSLTDTSSSQWLLLVATTATVGSYTLVGIIYGEIVTVALSFGQWFVSIPTYTIMIPVFAFCNLHDVSWGTKSLDAATGKKNTVQMKVEREYKDFRNYFLFAWVVSNGSFIIYCVSQYDKYSFQVYSFGVFQFLLWVTIITVLVKLAGSLVYAFVHVFTRRQERQMIQERQTVQEESKTPRPVKSYFAAVLWVIPLERTAWIAILNVLLGSPLFGIVSVGFFYVSFILSILTIWNPLGIYLLPAATLIWRKCCAFEFAYNSFDGKIALRLGVENKTAGAGIHQLPEGPDFTCQEACTGKYKEAKRILQDPFSRKCLFYLLYVKPLVVLSGFIICAGTALIGVIFLENWENSIPILSKYLTVSVNDTQRLVIICICGALFLPFCRFFDSAGRQIVNSTLAEQVMHLMPRASEVRRGGAKTEPAMEQIPPVP